MSFIERLSLFGVQNYWTVSIWDPEKCPLLRGCPLFRESCIGYRSSAYFASAGSFPLNIHTLESTIDCCESADSERLGMPQVGVSDCELVGKTSRIPLKSSR